MTQKDQMEMMQQQQQAQPKPEGKPDLKAVGE